MITAGHYCCQDITLQLSLQIQKIYKKKYKRKKEEMSGLIPRKKINK